MEQDAQEKTEVQKDEVRQEEQQEEEEEEETRETVISQQSPPTHKQDNKVSNIPFTHPTSLLHHTLLMCLTCLNHLIHYT